MNQVLELLEISLDDFLALENLRDLEQFDSITHMNLVLMIEGHVNRTLSSDEMLGILNPHNLRALL